MTRFIPTKGWMPVDTRVRVSNVSGLVAALGGSALYGRDPTVPLRELIQNGCDAVRARRLLENRSDDWGRIRIRIWEQDSSDWIEISDTGTGMSSRVLTGPLIDFGSAFWDSAMVHQELPGLAGKRFESVGKYGIGFFSTFMWGEQVKVITRRFDEGPRDSRVLEFKKGLSQPPILRPADATEQLEEPGTSIQVRLIHSVRSPGGLLWRLPSARATLAELCTAICPALSVSLYTNEGSSEWHECISANDWESMPSTRLIGRVATAHPINDEQVARYANNVREIRDHNGRLLGRACIMPGLLGVYKGHHHGGAVTVGGFRSSPLYQVTGILLGYPVRAARDVGLPLAGPELMREWASEQAELIVTISDEPRVLYECAIIVRRYGGSCGRLPIAEHHNGWLTTEDIEKLAPDSEEFLIVQDVAFWPDFEEDRSVLLGNVLVTGVAAPGVLNAGFAPSIYCDDQFLPRKARLDSKWSLREITLEGAVVEALARGWSVPIEQVLESSEFPWGQESIRRTISKRASKGTASMEANVSSVIRRPS